MTFALRYSGEAPALVADGRVSAEVNLQPEKRAELAAIDGRVPVVGFERLIVVPEDDLKARLDVLYTLLLGS